MIRNNNESERQVQSVLVPDTFGVYIDDHVLQGHFLHHNAIAQLHKVLSNYVLASAVEAVSKHVIVDVADFEFAVEGAE